MTFVYFDTNVIRYFAQAFQTSELDASLRSRIAVSPLSIAELLAQLGGKGIQLAFEAIRAIDNWTGADSAYGLDWPQEFIKEYVFGIPIPSGARLPRVFDKLSAVCRSNPDFSSFRRTAQEIKNVWEKETRKSAETRRSNTLLLRHQKINAPRERLLESSLKSLRAISGVSRASGNRQDILSKLSAYHELEIKTIAIALRDHNFNFLSPKRMNDQVDLEQLIYLADDRLRYLTCDKGYKKLEGTPQWPRIRIEIREKLIHPQSATCILRDMLE
ncbi:MAG: hypothetical protein HYX72_15345 [Acidobacteria bacterium]|nr:hypothetical protein [Acidobacteriota bacterium]